VQILNLATGCKASAQTAIQVRSLRTVCKLNGKKKN
jgi:hypothetical protein